MVGAIADPASQEKFPITLKSRIEVICNITELFHNTNKSYKEKYLQKNGRGRKIKMRLQKYLVSYTHFCAFERDNQSFF